MSVFDLIRKRDSGKVATATPATPATHRAAGGGSVAKVAKVAVASPPELNIEAGAHDVGSKAVARWWRVHFPEREPVEVACYPDATYDEVLAMYPLAAAAEPFVPSPRKPAAPMTKAEEVTVRAWLTKIGETDPATIADVLEQCQRDAEARDFYSGKTSTSRH